MPRVGDFLDLKRLAIVHCTRRIASDRLVTTFRQKAKVSLVFLSQSFMLQEEDLNEKFN